MREHHDRRGGGAAFKILFQPFELLVTERAETARFKIHDIHQTDEMHAVGIEAVPARAFGATPVTFLVAFRVLIEYVMLARHIMRVELAPRDDLARIVEFV